MSTSELTVLLDGARKGDTDARDALMAVAYQELRHLVHAAPRVSPTALVNEAWTRLSSGGVAFEHRRHFFGAAARAMRRVMVDRARVCRAQMRDAAQERLCLHDAEVEGPAGMDIEVLELERALSELETFQPRLARMLELRFFAGLGLMETAAALSVSPATVRRDWSYASVWLVERLSH
jgi:RNA polymerase sigma factor (TIGR02999 family)